MARVLLSHAALDRPQARRLAEGLRRAGHHPWLVEDEVRVGHSVLDVLHDGLRDSDFVVVCLSEAALRSGWQEAELRLILNELPAEQAPELIPVRLDDAELPESLRGRASVDLPDADWDLGLTELVGRLSVLDKDRPKLGQIPLKDMSPDAALSSCSPKALRLMQAATVFAPSPIYLRWLVDTAGMETSDAPETLNELLNLGLVEFDAQGQQVDPCHRALEKLRTQLTPELLAIFQISALKVLGIWTLAMEDSRGPDAMAKLASGRPHVEKMLQITPSSLHPRHWSMLSVNWGVCVSELGDLSSGRNWLEQALAVSVQDPAWTMVALKSAMNLSRVCQALGNYKHARSSMERAIAIAQGLPGEKRATLIPEVLAQLALVVQERDPFAARQIAQQALSLAESKPEVTAAARGWYLFLVAICTRDVDGAASARPLCEQALGLMEAAGDQNDASRMVGVLAGLGSILRQLEDFDGASAALERALSIERQRSGTSQFDVARLLSSLADVRLAQGRLEEAKSMFEHARDHWESRYGPEAESLGSILHNLGMTLLGMGDRVGARDCFNRALPLLERMRGPDHPYVTSCRANLILTMESGSDESKMEMDRLISLGLALYTPNPGPGAQPLQRALVLARSQQVLPAELSHAFSEALRAAEEGDNPGNAARAGLLLGAVLGSQGAWESAQQHLERALRASKQAANEMLVAEAYRLLGDATLHGSHYEDARLNYAEAIRRYDAQGLFRKASKTRLLLLTMLLQLGHGQEAKALSPPLRRALADGLFTDAQERENVELALRLADSQSRNDTP